MLFLNTSSPSSRITDLGYELWREHKSRIMSRPAIQSVSLVRESHLTGKVRESYRTLESSHFNSMHEFIVCFAFDVYRRGWQYAAGVANGTPGTTYLAHWLRNNALERGSTDWAIVSDYQDLYWSWGNYFVNLVSHPKLGQEVSPQRVAEYLQAVKSVISSTGRPTWSSLDLIDEGGRISDLDHMRAVGDWVEQTAHEAKLPMLEMRAIDQSEGISLAMSFAWDAASTVVGVPLNVLSFVAKTSVKQISPEFAMKAGDYLDRMRKRGVNKIFKGSYGYPGLVSPINEDETTD
jgi:hypothetical protein